MTENNTKTVDVSIQEKDKKDFVSAYAADVAEKLARQLEAGTSPYQKAWRGAGIALPYNPRTGARYQGINALKLMMEGRDSAKWMTLRQINELGGRVRRGEKGVRCFYYAEKWIEADDPAQGRVRVLLPCPFTVFNLEQTTGVNLFEAAPPPHRWDPSRRAEALLQATGAAIEHREGDTACYSPSEDRITLPLKTQFPDAASYYDTALHELGHWTGHPSRLGRLDPARPAAFGSPEYAAEELRAETSSLMVASELGLPHRRGQHAADIGAWIEVLRKDPRELLRACSEAQRISEYILSYDRPRVFCADLGSSHVFRADQDRTVGRLAALIDDRGLILPKTFSSRVAELKAERAIMDREARLLVARDTLDPATNSARLLAAKLRGVIVSQDPAEFLERCAGASPELAASAFRAVRRSLGAVAAEQAAEKAREAAESEKGAERLRLMQEFAGRFAQAAPDAEERVGRAPAEQREEVLGRAREIASREAGLEPPGHRARDYPKSPPRQRFRRLSGDQERVL